MSDEQIKDLRPAEFKRYGGVEPDTFQRMVELVSKRLTMARRKTGRPPKLTVEDQVLLTLEYWREYRTLFHLVTSWGLHESHVCRVIRRVEDILTKSRAFRLPGKKVLPPSNHQIEFVVVDVAETRIERPKKQQSYSSGKKRRHPLKSQSVVNGRTWQVICTHHGRVRVHDFAFYQRSNLELDESLEVLADSGYQGLEKLPEKSRTPQKKPRKSALTEEQKQSNRELARRRVVVEHVIRSLPILRILTERYRHGRQRFSLRFNMMAGLYDYALGLG